MENQFTQSEKKHISTSLILKEDDARDEKMIPKSWVDEFREYDWL